MLDKSVEKVKTHNLMASTDKTNKSPGNPRPTKKPRKIEAKAPAEPSNRTKGLTVVGIGASAGGLEAMRSFFSTVSSDTGMAFVVVTHLHPEHESHLAELLQKFTQMPASQVTKKTKIKPNHIYVIPPNRTILMTDTHLDTAGFTEPRGRRMPIDIFFRSLASENHEPIAVILSGGGTDGSVGVKDIKEVGGLIMVQHPEDAEYDSMPRAALSTGLADVVLPAAELAEKLSDYAEHRPRLPHDPGQLTEGETETLQRILAQIHARTGNDFTQYKRCTILRRVERRMQLNGFNTLDAYLAFLRSNPLEAQAIFNDILIGVTNFFRDRVSWEALETKVIPELFKKRQKEHGLRVWSIGCATGEEAYGLAILLFEEAERQSSHTPIQVFASDLDERSITHAREGLYPAAIETDVSPERLSKFFTREGEYYRVRRELRDAVLFTNHNIMRDPPFSRQDLIACRNVLIYLQREVQEKIFDIFHYSLNPGGYLFLGSSESAEHLPDLFQIVDKNHRLYQSRGRAGDRFHVPSLPLMPRRVMRNADASVLNRTHFGRFIDDPMIQEEQHQRALESYGPPSIIVDERYRIQHVSETAGRYLHQPKGPVTGDLLTMVRPEMQLELRSALFHAFDKGKATISRPVYVQFNGHRHRVLVAVRPQTAVSIQIEAVERLALVLFIEDEIENPEEAVEQSLTLQSDADHDQLFSQLQTEAERLREQLQITIEEYESSNEEMKAANEELQSINEEYRSATEELETSKEELQSVNEELQTVNSEMHHKLEEVSRAHRELENLMGATDIATLYLDRELRIQRFTAGIQELFNILSVDRGRRISDLTHKMGYDKLVEDADQVLRTLIPVEQELQRVDGRWFLMRLRPYRTVEDRIEGVVITFIDVTKLKETEQELVRSKELLEERVNERTRALDEANQKLRQARDLFQALFNSNPIPTVLTRLKDNILMDANTEFLSYFGFERDKVVGRSLEELSLGLDLETASQEPFIELIRKDGGIRGIELEIQHPSGEKRHILDSIQYLNVDGTDTLISTFIDITERVRAEREVRSLASDLTVAEQQERSRISQILHDELQQRIFAVKIQLTALSEALHRGDSQSMDVDFNQLESMLDESIAITRNLSINLSPAILQGDSLADALNWLASQMHDQYGLQVDVESNGVATLFEDTLRILLFQVAREALFNVVKHADTLHATVRFEKSDSQISMTIADDGKGFDIEKQKLEKDDSGGLTNLRHRLGLMGCTLQVNSSPEKGTQVMVYIPVQQVK